VRVCVRTCVHMCVRPISNSPTSNSARVYMRRKQCRDMQSSLFHFIQRLYTSSLPSLYTARSLSRTPPSRALSLPHSSLAHVRSLCSLSSRHTDIESWGGGDRERARERARKKDQFHGRQYCAPSQPVWLRRRESVRTWNILTVHLSFCPLPPCPLLIHTYINIYTQTCILFICIHASLHPYTSIHS